MAAKISLTATVLNAFHQMIAFKFVWVNGEIRNTALLFYQTPLMKFGDGAVGTEMVSVLTGWHCLSNQPGLMLNHPCERRNHSGQVPVLTNHNFSCGWLVRL
jgi:hypothetical protein